MGNWIYPFLFDPSDLLIRGNRVLLLQALLPLILTKEYSQIDSVIQGLLDGILSCVDSIWIGLDHGLSVLDKTRIILGHRAERLALLFPYKSVSARAKQSCSDSGAQPCSVVVSTMDRLNHPGVKSNLV